VRIVVAPDKFKGTLSAPEAARAMTAGALAADPSVEIVVVSVSDGGEGFLSVLLARGGGEAHNVTVRGPLGTLVGAPIGYLPGGRVVLESARACGLGLTPARYPLGATSAGVGDLIRHALTDPSPPAEIVVGIGGTASTDGGVGAAEAAGWRFLDAAGRELPPGGGALASLHAIDGAGVDRRLAHCRLVAACDVGSPLVGPRGSARLFGPQKGASIEQREVLARGLERLAAVVKRDLGVDVADIPFGGAGGGLGAGLRAFFGAELTSGFDYVARETGLAEEIARADIVLTGEGRMDAGTEEGKVVAGVLQLAGAAGVRTLVVVGEVLMDDPSAFDSDVTIVSMVERFGTQAITRAAACLSSAVTEALTTDSRG
jgi:glycerate kinase